MSRPKRSVFRLSLQRTARSRSRPTSLHLEHLESRLQLASEAADLPAVTISEIMYHPLGDRKDAEFVELLNRGSAAVDLTGWGLNRGVQYRFSDYVLQPQDRVVVAANLSAFLTLYPDTENVVGGWQGALSNRGERIDLVDASGQLVDTVRYADQGDWATRVLDEPDHGHRGWKWEAEHDGEGNSLELINAALSNDDGQNWQASIRSGGTPGRVNSVDCLDVAPLVLNVNHDPPIPSSTDTIVVTASMVDESPSGTVAALHYKVDQDDSYHQIAMYDDGFGADERANDGIFTASMPPQPDRSIVQFHVTAVDASGLARSWPSVRLDDANRRPDALLQVLDSAVDSVDWSPDRQPVTYLIMTSAERAELADIGDGPFDEAESNAKMNGTFIRVDGRGVHVRYLVGIRNRGGSSRIGPPNNYRVDFPHDRPWDEAASLILNALYVPAEVVGHAVYRLAGLPAAVASPVHVSVNGIDMADPAIPGMTTVYSQLEVIDGTFPDRHFSGDSTGNLYRAEAIGDESGDLQYEGPDADAYRDTYTKITNEAEDDWSDLIRLTDVLNHANDDQFYEQVQEVIDVDQWMRFLALDALLGNRETGLNAGTGDNYWLYRGVEDPRFQLIPHDLDTIFGTGRVAQPNRSIFSYTAVPGLQRLLTHPDTVPLYYRALIDLIDSVFNPETMNPLLDQLLDGVAANREIEAYKQFVEARVAGVIAQLPQEFLITSSLPVVAGYYRTAQPNIELVGTADAVRTRSVLVDGQPAEWSPVTREWSLTPRGVARVETLVDANSVWRYLDDGSELTVHWQRAGFVDTEWSLGAAPLGYGLPELATTVDSGPNPNDRYVTTYFRRTFEVPRLDQIQELTLRLQRDDGAIVYLNGNEIARSNMPDGQIDFQTVAQSWVGGADHRQFHSFQIDVEHLVAGTNVLAVEVHQRSPLDRDLWFDLSLEAAVGSQTGGVVLQPGVNRVMVQAFDGPDGSGTEIQRGFVDVWYDGAAGIDREFCDLLRRQAHVAPAQLGAGTLNQDTILAPCGPAYRVTGEIVVPAGITLNILPGTTLFFDDDAGLTIDGGRLVAQGSVHDPIRFTRTPGSNTAWNGIQFRDTQLENQISHAVVEYAATADGMIGVERSKLTVGHVTFDHSDRFRIRTVGSSLIVRDSIFEDIFPGDDPPTTDNQSEHIWGSGILADGQLLIENNYFGTTKGHNDAIDFDGAQRPGPIPIIRDNVFAGSGDDLLDLEADAHIEGNLFQRVAKDAYNAATGDANAISAGGGRHYVVVRNQFHDVDHAVQVKDGAFLTFQNNTVFHAAVSAIYFDLEDRSPGRGALVEDSIFAATQAAFAAVDESTELTVNRSFVPADAVNFGVGNSSLSARLIEPERGDLRLGAGSPAIGSGRNGIDRGALVTAGATISGEPDARTARSSATLEVAGPGISHYRFRTNGAPWSEERSTDLPISLTELADGTYQVEVIGKNSAGQWQSDDQATKSRAWTVDRGLVGLRLNEVLAANVAAVNIGGQFPDFIELFNGGANAVDLSGLSLTDDPSWPRRFVIPPGTLLEPEAFLVLSTGPATPQSPLTLNFGLRREGEAVYLFDTVDRGGGLLDSIEYGFQVEDYSLGRVGHDLSWQLTVPTPGEPNAVQPGGDPQSLRINEWFTRGEVRVTDDYVELYNPDSLPVSLSGLLLSDDPLSRPARYTIPQHSYIAGHGYLVIQADDETAQGADHLPFRFAADQGHLALRYPDHSIIDQVLYHWQSIDHSQGRFPDGGDDILFQTLPTPGSANRVTRTERDVILAWDDTWRYESSGSEPPIAWKSPDFDDSHWPRGPGLLAAEDGDLPAVIRTPLELGVLAYYFRRTFALDDFDKLGTFEMTTLIDDGAVFYLNGVEFLRLGMPAGPVTANTRANRGVGNATLEGPFEIPPHLLRQGDNTLAVEVHQVSAGNSDVVFGMALEHVREQQDVVTDRALSLLKGLRITEIMYDPAGDQALEFIELMNVSDEPLDLDGVRLDDGIEFTFGPQVLGPQQRLVVVRNTAAFAAQYGTTIHVAGAFTGGLGNRADEVRLLLPAPFDVNILRVTYADDWIPAASGQGYSLVVEDPLAPAAAWLSPDHWRRSQSSGGSPGQADALLGDFNLDGVIGATDLDRLCAAVRTVSTDRDYDLDGDRQVDHQDLTWWLRWVGHSVPGDANLDGVFDSQDFVQVFLAGRYEATDGIVATWAEGDWDCDGQFTSRDLVVVFLVGRYEADA